MALTRKMLKAMGIEDEKIDQIIDAHTETVDALKAESERYKGDAEKLKDTETKLAEANKKLDESEKDPYKVKYDAIKQEYEEYKSGVEKDKTNANKTSKYKELLKAAGVAEKRIEAIMRVTDLGKLELDESGALKDAQKLTESIKTEWADFIQSAQGVGATTATPPQNNGGIDYDSMTDEEYFKQTYEAQKKK